MTIYELYAILSYTIDEDGERYNTSLRLVFRGTFAECSKYVDDNPMYCYELREELT